MMIDFGARVSVSEGQKSTHDTLQTALELWHSRRIQRHNKTIVFRPSIRLPGQTLCVADGL